HQADRLGVEDTLAQPQRLGGVLEGAVPPVAEEAVGAAQTTDHQVEAAVVVQVPPGRAGHPAIELAEPGLGGDVAEAPPAPVVEELAAVGLGHEEVGEAVAVVVAEDRPDPARLEGNAAVAHLHETLPGGERQDALAGAVEEIGPAVAVDVADGERISLDV